MEPFAIITEEDTDAAAWMIIMQTPAIVSIIAVLKCILIQGISHYNVIPYCHVRLSLDLTCIVCIVNS